MFMDEGRHRLMIAGKDTQIEKLKSIFEQEGIIYILAEAGMNYPDLKPPEDDT